MDLLKNIDENSLLIASNQDKLSVLNYLSTNQVFLDLLFYNSDYSFLKIDHRYPFYLKKEFGIEPYLADRIKKYFDYIDISKDYQNEKIRKLSEIKKYLLKENIIHQSSTKFNKIYAVNDSFVPEFLKGNKAKLLINDFKTTPVKLIKALDPENMAYAVFEEVISLIEKGVELNKIHIVNSFEEDDLTLLKLFNDANIPVNLNKSKPLTDYPFMTRVIKILKSKGYDTCVEYIKKQGDQAMNEVIRLFNSYNSDLIKSNIDCFIHELKKLKVKSTVYNNGVEIIPFNALISRNDHYYILMNYYDEVFPKKYLDNDYLSNQEVLEINYPSTHLLSKYEKENTESILKAIDKLILVMPKIVLEKTREADLDLNREIKIVDYEYIVSNSSYLADLLVLDYAKKRFMYDKYNIKTADLEVLNNSFKDSYYRYIPQYSGLNKELLKELIEKRNTLSAYKLESYAKCPFSYLLNFLLEIDDFKENIFTYIGNVTHRALEVFLKTGDYDLEEIMNEFTFPEDEEYKYEVYQEVVRDNVEMIKTIVHDFHQTTNFTKILTEHSIKQPFDDVFSLSGIVDKVMFDETYKYFLVVDYKYSGKDFKREDLDKDYNIQLPLYLYALKKKYKEYQPAAMLYQETSLKKEKRGEELDYRMKGMVIDLVSVVRRIDPTESKIVGVQIKQDETLKNNANTVISVEDMDKLLVDTESRIKRMAEGIKTGDFKIYPLLVDYDQQSKNYIACKYCKFGSICYSKNKLLGGE
ncbi:MAG: hypothetical protein CVV60_05140 [Tenericutes bacterium HGW-Tenericutes-5]|nr:MAG: hypothetical protein CVV60_05140 [Tenericutes bacterium HGW-Tenericutes-5]